MPFRLSRVEHSDQKGILDRDTFFSYADRQIADGQAEDMGMAYVRLLNVDSYSLREGIQASDELIDDFYAAVAEQLDQVNIVTHESGVALVALVKQTDAEALVTSLSEMLTSHDDVGDVELKSGFCPHIEGLDAHAMLERARYAFDTIRFDSAQRLCRFDEAMCLAFDKRRYVIDHLDDAIARNEIRAFSQPIVRVITGRVCEIEVLCRWESDRFGTILPDEFIPQLEQSRQVHKLDATVARLACRQWREAKEQGVCVPFGINLSRLDFELCDIYQVVCSAMRTYGVPIDMLHVEVTESAESGSEELLRRGVKRFRDAGFTVYMDDFGTGYSSLAGLRDSDYDVVKLDRSLIYDVEENERSRVIAADAVSMLKRLGIQTLCEGVETLEQLRFLRMIGCEKAQGYFFGKPLDNQGILLRLTQEAERHEEPGLGSYLDAVGRVNLIDGTRADVQGVEASVFLGDAPVAVVESSRGHLVRLESNAAFDSIYRHLGAGSFDELIGQFSAGNGEKRRRLSVAAQRAKTSGMRQNVDMFEGGFFSTVSIEHVAQTSERDAYLVRVSPISSSLSIERERSLEQASPFLYSIYKRIDLFDLEEGTSKNLYLNEPLLRSHRMAGITIDEIREFCDRNVHPADRRHFLDFYDLASLEERIRSRNSYYDVAVARVRISPDKYASHIFTLIPMVVRNRRQVLSTLRAVDVDGASSYMVSGDERISDSALLKAILDGIDRYVFWKDDQRRFLGANNAFLNYYGFSSLDEIMGKTDEEVGWHVDNQPFRSDEQRVLEGESVLRARGTCYSRNELRKIEANKRPIVVSGEIVGLLGYFRDMGPADEEYRPDF